MAIFGWDASHFDGVLDLATLKWAKAEGIDFLTHKLGEGLTNVDPTQTALATAREAGITVLGGYWFCHGEDSPTAEADRCIAVADQYEPWWRDFAGWFWQLDCETETGHQLPSEAWIETFADELAAKTGRLVVTYASRGQYGDRLIGLRWPLWNADYGANPHLPFRQAYPGDGGRGWTKYSGQVPMFWQFGSNLTIGGRTTCDGNAYRGTLAQLEQTVRGGMAARDKEVDMPLTDADVTKLLGTRIDDIAPPAKGSTQYTLGQALRLLVPRSDYTANKFPPAVLAQLAAMAKTEQAIQATLATVTAAGGSVDTAALAAQIKAVGDTESAAVAALAEQVTDLEQRLAAAEEAAARAAAAVLAPPAA